MILKSMSRKEPSFGQLAAYMSDDKSDRAFDLHQHVFSNDPEAIAREFEENARLLGKRRGGNYLFHEILSIDTRDCGQSREVKEKLRLLALEFISQRCPRNMVYGALHRDHEGHLHYHLMISANERGEIKRQRLSPGQFNEKKREIERYAREHYPELKQDQVMDLTREEQAERRQTRKSRKEQEMEKRGAKLTKKEQLAQELRGMMAYAKSQAEFERLLQDKGLELYTRGKNVCVRPIQQDGQEKKPKAHRFSTLGIHQEYESFLDRMEPVIEESRVAGEKEKTDEAEQTIHSDEREKVSDKPRRARAERDGSTSDKDTYGKYDSNANLKNDFSPKQNPEDSQVPTDAFKAEMEDRRAKQRAAKEKAQSQSRGPKSRKR
jgi:hypothetical protein